MTVRLLAIEHFGISDFLFCLPISSDNDHILGHEVWRTDQQVPTQPCCVALIEENQMCRNGFCEWSLFEDQWLRRQRTLPQHSRMVVRKVNGRLGDFLFGPCIHRITGSSD